MKKIKLIFYKITDEYLASLEWYERIVIKALQFITRRPYDHVAVVLNGNKWESCHPYGITKSPFIERTGERYVHKETLVQFTQAAIDRMEAVAEKMLRENIRYNHRKFFLMLIIFPTHIIWDKLQWVPFQNNFLWGVFCSVFIGELFLTEGVTLRPGRYVETLTPGCIYDSPFVPKDEE